MGWTTFSAAAVLACLIGGVWAVRLQDFEDDQETAGDQPVEAKSSHGPVPSFLERGCEIDFTEERVTEQEEEHATSLALVSDAPATNENTYWEPANALARCKSGRKRRLIKLIVGVPVMMIGFSFAVISVTFPSYSGIVGKLVELGVPVTSNIIETFLTHVATPVFQLTMKVPLVFTQALMMGVLYSITTVVMAASFIFVVPQIAVGFVMPVLAVMAGYEIVSSASVDMLARVFGGGGKAPLCCCIPGQDANVTVGEEQQPSCALVSATEGASRCPPSWQHVADACPTGAAQSFVEKKPTVDGCECKNYEDCANNEFYQGHAWCEVNPKTSEGKACGTRYKLSFKKRWDHCTTDGDPLAFALNDTNSSQEDALATFLPNRFTRWTTTRFYSLGTWVDESRGIVTVTTFKSGTKCFAATPSESLQACAIRCRTEGAPTATMMSGGDELNNIACAAFAYNRQLHLCLRLPDFASDARLPYLNSNSGEGWQSFVSKFEETKGRRGLCSAETIREIQTDFNIVRDKNNGHLYVECVGSEKLQKVSCLENECGRPGWCFVKNHCRKGSWRIFGGCTKLSHEDALKCPGESGAVPGGDPPTNYFDVRNSVARCKSSGRKRVFKAVAFSAMLMVAGDLVTFNIMNQGVIYQLAINTLEGLSTTIINVFTAIGVPVGTFVSQLMTSVIGSFQFMPLLIPIWAIVFVGLIGVAAVFVTAAYTIALTPAAAVVLTPYVLAFAGAAQISQKTAHLLTNMVAFGNHHPKCCCKKVEQQSDDNVTISDGACATFSPVNGGVPSCPAEWTDSNGEGCDAISEVFKYDHNQSLQGCQCKNYDDCKNNAPHQGHAWCHTSGKCGYRSLFGGRWDHCLFSEKFEINETTGDSILDNDFDLKDFIPNRFSRIDLFGPGQPLTLGTYTDSSHMLTTAKPPRKGLFGFNFGHNFVNMRDKRECFVALHRETLGACAKACSREGAPSAENNTYKCAAFAWNAEDRLCVRLPIFAADSKYTPFVKQWEGRGWQNFISKFVAANGKQACPKATYVELRDAGYAIARDKNNGHMYLRCQGQQGDNVATQKASCIARECDGDPWCMVKNHCGGLFRRCRSLKQSPLQCLRSGA